VSVYKSALTSCTIFCIAPSIIGTLLDAVECGIGLLDPLRHTASIRTPKPHPEHIHYNVAEPNYRPTRPSHTMAADKITVRSLSVQLPHGLGPSAFGLATAPPCPISVTLAIHLRPDVVPSCVSADTMSGLGVNYSAVTKAVYAALADPSRTWGSPAEIVRASGTIPLELDAVKSVDGEVEMPRGLLHAQSAVYGAKFSRGQERGAGWTVEIKGLGVACVVGLHPHEMGERQRLEVDLAVNGWNAEEQESFPHKELADEALRVSLGSHLCVICGTVSCACWER
jgi:hypothetical protein